MQHHQQDDTTSHTQQTQPPLNHNRSNHHVTSRFVQRLVQPCCYGGGSASWVRAACAVPSPPGTAASCAVRWRGARLVQTAGSAWLDPRLGLSVKVTGPGVSCGPAAVPPWGWGPAASVADPPFEIQVRAYRCGKVTPGDGRGFSAGTPTDGREIGPA